MTRYEKKKVLATENTNSEMETERSDEAVDRPLIYVVDDDPAVAEVIEALLDLYGHKSKVFTKPKEALDSFITEPIKPKLLITDFQMPKMNGMELLQACKRDHPSLRCISASGTLHVEEMKVYPIQPDKHLAKPFYPRQLLDAVEEMVTG
jgi:CheY-like chemotaxis protein